MPEEKTNLMDGNEEMPDTLIEGHKGVETDNSEVARGKVNDQTENENGQSWFIADRKPKTVKEAIEVIKFLHEVEISTRIISHYRIGRVINGIYKSAITIGKLENISDHTGVSVESLLRACKFSSRYSPAHIDKLLHGDFSISWDQIAENLFIAPDDFVEIVQGSDSPEAFRCALVKLGVDRMKKGMED